ncbi:MAG: response regulator transcription factor [Kofleriaceae bacterium]
MRAGIRSILEDRFNGIEILEASNGDRALTLLDDKLDAVVLDLTMPGRSGMDLLVEIKGRFPKLPVLIMSLHGEEQFAVRSLRAGASGYLTKSAAPEQLVAAFEKIVRGGRYISDAVAERLADDVSGGTTAPHARLSDREFDVMRAIASGEAIGQIAVRMHLSVKTISTYRARLLEKMGMSTNSEVTRYAITNGLV